MMAVSGILGEYKGSQAREVTMTLKEYDAMKKQMAIEKASGYEDLTADDDEGYDEPVEEVDEEEDD